MPLMKLKNHYKDKNAVNIKNTIFILFLAVFFAIAVLYLFSSLAAIYLNGKEAVAIATSFPQSLPGNRLMNCIVSEMQEKYINQDIDIGEEKYATSHKDEVIPMSEEPVKLEDIYSVSGETAVFKCYEKDAVQYIWETYDTSLSDWATVPQEEIIIMIDELNREISTYKVAAVQENDGLIIRCRTDLQYGETVTEIGTLYILDDIINISAGDYIADSGKYISVKDIPVNVTFRDGSESIVNGLNGLYFLETIEEDSSVTNDMCGNPIERLTVVNECHEYVYMKPEKREATIRYYSGNIKIDIPIALEGEDNEMPAILQVDINEEIDNSDESGLAVVTITATDNSTSYSELEYAFLPEADEPDDEDWTSVAHINVDISVTENWKAYCRDKNGNIANLSINTSGEVINDGKVKAEILGKLSVSLEVNNTWSTYNKIIVADMGDEILEYRYVMTEGDEDSGWITQSEYVVTENGTYTVYARDSTGNVFETEIVVSNIDNNPPVIQFIKEKEI